MIFSDRTAQNFKVIPKLLKALTTFRSRWRTGGKIRKKNLAFQIQRKKKWKIKDMLFNWTAVDLMETGFSLNSRPNGAENTPGWRHASSYHRFREVQLIGQFGLYFWKLYFSHFFIAFPRPEWFLIIGKKMAKNID